MLEEEPDWVLAYGDTNSTLAGTLAAIILNIPVAHIEAGLRSFNRRMPEEHNRILTDHAADLLFSPTPTAMAHLIREGIPDKRIKQVGDVMYDVALLFGPLAAEKSKLLTKLSFSQGDFVLATFIGLKQLIIKDFCRKLLGLCNNLHYQLYCLCILELIRRFLKRTL